ncbi:MAG: gluconate 2-dehydrogenase subunit 3 family protein, partial [Chitinophagaceae bacterium]|nr:gluconate 2-dehydrogenase subunit 3 family protein [Chitinophagaceae bacterium]
MDRRKSIKTLLIGAAGTGVIVEACKETGKKETGTLPDVAALADRMQEEKDDLTKMGAGETFF